MSIELSKDDIFRVQILKGKCVSISCPVNFCNYYILYSIV